MSFRDTSGRQNGDSRVAALNNGNRTLLLPEPARIRSIGVKGGAAATVIDITVDGVSIRAQSNQATGNVAAGAFKDFAFGGVVINAGSVLVVTSTQTDALASVSFMAA